MSGAVVSSGVAPLSTGRVNAYLMPDAVIEAQTPAVVGLARDLRQFSVDDDEFVRRAHDWVSEVIAWPVGRGERRVPITSMEVLFTGIGCTFGRSHLLAALLRAGGVPAALCYTHRPRPTSTTRGVACVPKAGPPGTPRRDSSPAPRPRSSQPSIPPRPNELT